MIRTSSSASQIAPSIQYCTLDCHRHSRMRRARILVPAQHGYFVVWHTMSLGTVHSLQSCNTAPPLDIVVHRAAGLLSDGSLPIGCNTGGISMPDLKAILSTGLPDRQQKQPTIIHRNQTNFGTTGTKRLGITKSENLTRFACYPHTEIGKLNLGSCVAV